LKRFYWRAWWI